MMQQFNFNYKELDSNYQMNPYFASSFAYPNTAQNQYGYNQMTIVPQPLQGYPQPQPTNTIESMYTAVHPYNSQQFLISTFGNKMDYIQIFLTLSHEDKLKMYLLMQQKKLYGEITDKDAYQKILRQIAQKLQNYNNFHQASKKVENSEEKKKKDLDSKIDSFCEVSFQKLNIPKIGTEIPAVTQPKFQEIDDIDDQWVESTTEEVEVPKQQNQNQAISQGESQFNSFYAHESNKENQTHSMTTSQQSNPIVFNMFNFDSDMERAMTKEIGLKKESQMEKLSIWELQVDESQLKTNQPNLRQVFKKKESASQKLYIETKEEEKAIRSSCPLNSFDLYAQYNSQQEHSKSQFNFGYPKEPESSFLSKSQSNNEPQNDFAFLSMSQPAATSYNFTFEQPVSQSQSEDINSILFEVPKTKNQQQYMEEQWQDGLQGLNSPQKNEPQQPLNEIHSQPIQQNPLSFVFQQVKSPPFINVQPVQPNENLFDFDSVTQSKLQVQAVINLQAADLFLSSTSQKQSQKEDTKLAVEQYQLIIPEIPQEIVQTVVDLELEHQGIMNSQLFLPDNEKKYDIIENLKMEFTQSQKRFLRKELKSKSFQCNTDFYLTVINHLRQVSLEATSEFEHFNEQFKIVKEMHVLTGMFTSVVDEEDEEKVERAVRQSKALYNKIYNKSSITQKFTEHLLSDKNKEKGLNYKLGRVLIDSCINGDLISRASAQDNPKNVFNSFCLLFILQKINSLNKLKTFAEALITSTNQEIDGFKSLDEFLFRAAEENTSRYAQVETYIKGLLKITSICERMVQLMKACFIKTNSNLVKTLKNCRDVKNRFANYCESQSNALYPASYGNLLKESIQKNCSVYDLHAKFSTLAQKTPICQICLLELGSLGSHHEQKGWYHYSCFNLMKSITSLDYI